MKIHQPYQHYFSFTYTVPFCSGDFHSLTLSKVLHLSPFLISIQSAFFSSSEFPLSICISSGLESCSFIPPPERQPIFSLFKYPLLGPKNWISTTASLRLYFLAAIQRFSAFILVLLMPMYAIYPTVLWICLSAFPPTYPSAFMYLSVALSSRNMKCVHLEFTSFSFCFLVQLLFHSWDIPVFNFNPSTSDRTYQPALSLLLFLHCQEALHLRILFLFQITNGIPREMLGIMENHEMYLCAGILLPSSLAPYLISQATPILDHSGKGIHPKSECRFSQWNLSWTHEAVQEKIVSHIHSWYKICSPKYHFLWHNKKCFDTTENIR